MRSALIPLSLSQLVCVCVCVYTSVFDGNDPRSLKNYPYNEKMLSALEREKREENLSNSRVLKTSACVHVSYPNNREIDRLMIRRSTIGHQDAFKIGRARFAQFYNTNCGSCFRPLL